MSETKKINEQIEFLKKLQVIDIEIYALKEEKSDMPEKIKSLEELLEAKKKGIKDTEGILKNLQLKLKENEISLQEKEEHIKKLQIQLYQLKSNKEYSAMLTEIGSLKADGSLIEDEIIKMMDEIENVKKKVAEEVALFKKEEFNAQKEKDAIGLRIRELDARLAELSEQREKIVPNIERDIRHRYERVLENRGGVAIVPVQDGACGGCHMNLPPQIVNEAKLKEEIVACGSCSRILYVDDDVEIN